MALTLHELVHPATPNFAWYEFFVSRSFPKLAAALPHIIKPKEVESLRWLVVVLLQPARGLCEFPFSVQSGFRSSALNVAVEGSIASQHMVGQAVDFSVARMEPERIYEWYINNCRQCFGQLILYPKRGFIHISLPSVHHRGDYEIR